MAVRDEPAGDLAGLSLYLLLFEGVDELDRGEEADPPVMMLNGMDAKSRGDVGLAGTGTADQDDVVRVVEELAAMELAHERLVDLALWSDISDERVYPTVQIAGDGLLPGMSVVVEAFSIDDPWMRLNFMLTGDARLGGQRPIDALREGRIVEVVKAVQAYGEHGAA